MEKVNDLVKTEGLDDLSDKGVIYRDPCPLPDSDSIVKAVLVGAGPPWARCLWLVFLTIISGYFGMR